MKLHIITRVVLLTVLLTAVTAGAGRDPVDDFQKAHARMADALRNADVDELVSCYTEDARLSFPLRPDIIGRDEIRRQMEYVLGLGVRGFRIEEDDLFVGEDVIVQSGVCIFFNETGQEFSRSRFMTVWRKSAGRWRIHRDFVT